MVKNNLFPLGPLNFFFIPFLCIWLLFDIPSNFQSKKKIFNKKNIQILLQKPQNWHLHIKIYRKKKHSYSQNSQIWSQISPPNCSTASLSTASDSNIYPYRTTEFSKHKTETRHQSKRIPKIHHPWELNRQRYRWSSWDLICFLASSLVLKFQKNI